MPRRAAALLLVLAAAAPAADPPVPAPEGFVTDRAGVIEAGVRARLTALLTELRDTTGAEIAVLTVDTTEPLDDFTYAMRVAEAWKPGRRREHTGLLVLVAVRDRKLRVLTGYGLEGVLPDGRVGAIQDAEMMPAFRAGRLAEGIERGVRAFAGHIAAEKGVTLTGVPPPRARGSAPAAGPSLPTLALLLGIVLVLLYLGAQAPRGVRRRRGWYAPGGFGGGFGGGGFGGGGGGFGGFGGGSFGGGGAGRSW